MKEVADLLNAMRDFGVASQYALFGIAQMRYLLADGFNRQVIPSQSVDHR